jgi:O-acetyl-ADP-ribose deacetylase (regulator of RNase III)
MNSPRWQVGNWTIHVVSGSIDRLQQQYDALVSSDDNYLSHGGGVSAALWRAAGSELAAHVGSVRPQLRLGDVHVTPAFGLNARLLLHAVTIDFDENRRMGPRDARLLAGAVLDTAREQGCKTLALPLIGTGAGRASPEMVASALAQAINDRADQPGCLTSVSLVLLKGADEAGESFVRQLPARPALGSQVATVANVLGEHGTRLAQAWRWVEQSSDSTQSALVLVFELLLQGMLASGVALAEREAEVWRTSTTDVGQEDRMQAVVRAVGATETMGQTLDRVAIAWETAGHPLEASVLASLRGAVAARNQVVHHLHEVDSASAAALERTLLKAIREAVTVLLDTASQVAKGALSELAQRVFVAEAPSSSTPAAESHTDGMVAEGVGRTSHFAVRAPTFAQFVAGARIVGAVAGLAASSQKSAPAASIAEPRPLPPQAIPSDRPRPAVHRADPKSGTAHVRRLHEFLFVNLSREALQEELARLRAEGYRGTDELCFLEFCVRMENPVEYLASEFSQRELQRLVTKELGGAPAGKLDDRALAHLLLESFGFPACPRPTGLADAQRDVSRMAKRVATADIVELRGLVSHAAVAMEEVLEILIRFVCQVVFCQSPEARYREHRALANGQGLSRSSLGTRLELLDKLAKDIANHPDRVAALARSVDVRRLAPKGTQGIAAFRNKFAHSGTITEATPIAEARHIAKEFFNQSVEFLDYLSEPEGRLFPHVVRIDLVTVDRWGRRVVEAIGEDGVKEYVFTDISLVPGELYYMHPLSNPLRVDPILLPAGQMGEGGD